MLVSFGAKNFSSFKEGFDISFRFGNACPEQISQGKSISNIICVKGANGAGKTNILKALNFISSFISRSFDIKPDSHILFDSYFSSITPSEFYVSFIIGDILYTYEAILTDKKVINEKLYRKINREVLVLERDENEIKYIHKDFSELEKIPVLRSNVSIISMARQFGLGSVSDIWLFFTGIMSNVSYSGLMMDAFELDKINELMHSNKELLSFTKRFVSKFDPSIKDIFIKESETTVLLTGSNKKTFDPWFVYDVDGEVEFLSFHNQSSGTKSLYKQSLLYYFVIEHGSVLVMDEFDINLHPHILPHLIDFFLDEDINKNNAQLLFTTHNTEILDILGRYRTYLVNKDGTESFCYRLDEIKGDIIRNDRSIAKVYNQGKIGGVPRL